MIKENLQIQILNRFDQIKTMVKTIQDNESGLRPILQDIQKRHSENGDLKGEDFKQELIDFKFKQWESHVINDTVNSITVRIIELYQLAKTSGVELDLNKEDEDFIEGYLKKGKIDLFSAKNGKIVILDQTYYDSIKSDLTSNIGNNNGLDMILSGVLKFKL